MTVSARHAERPDAALRPPQQVMRLARMGSFFATRLSFVRVLIRELMTGGWTFSKPRFDIDCDGYGTAIYRVSNGLRSYSLVVFASYLAPEHRTDRVIATAWDATFALHDGDPTPDDIERLRQNVPRQEAGRCSAKEIVLCRANRSVRLFDHVVQRLAAGHQPDEAQLLDVGYLMRTTAVYGNGKFGIADRFRIAGRPEMRGPFQAEMLAVYLVRLFTLDLVQHVAHCRSPDTFVPLERRYQRFLGIGNATGLGMAPYMMTHPRLIGCWMAARETALARARAARLEPPRFTALLARARAHVSQWRVDDPRQSTRIAQLAADLERLSDEMPRLETADDVFSWTEDHLGLEAQELVASLLIELQPGLVDGLAADMATDEPLKLDGAMTVAAALQLLDRHYDWAMAIDVSDPQQRAQFWYVSEEKLEPRLGNRLTEPGAELERPFAVAHDVQAARADLLKAADGDRIAAFVMRHPEHRHIMRRVQLVSEYPYAEIRDNLVAASCLPVDILRCKLSFFGAAKFDPKSDRWTRINMFQGAPLPDELANPNADDWCFPVL